MKLQAVLVSLLLAATLVAGCGGKKDSPPPTTSSPPPTTAGNTTTPPANTTTPPPPPPPPPPENFSGVLKFKTPPPNDPAMNFNAKPLAKAIEVTVYLNYTGAGPWAINGPGTPPSGKAQINFTSPLNVTTKIEFDPNQGAATAAGKVYGPLAATVTTVPAGQWKVEILGTGQNVQANWAVLVKYA